MVGLGSSGREMEFVFAVLFVILLPVGETDPGEIVRRRRAIDAKRLVSFRGVVWRIQPLCCWNS